MRLRQHQFIIAAAIMAAFILPAVGETIPKGALRDSRVQTAEYHADQVYRIRGQVGRASMVQLEEGETLSGDNATLGMGDSEAWKVAVKGNNIVFKPVVAHPGTNMLVTTNKRTYAFSLTLVNANHKQAPTYILRFTYPDTIKKRDIQEAENLSKAMDLMKASGVSAGGLSAHNMDYWAYGDRNLTPTAAWDNGRFTFFSFNNGRDLPTVYKIMPDKTEALINTHIEGDTVVVHETAARFVLRLGKSVLGIDNRGFNATGQFNRTGTDDDTAVRIVK